MTGSFLSGITKVVITNLAKVSKTNPFGILLHELEYIANLRHIYIVSLLVSESRTGSYALTSPVIDGCKAVRSTGLFAAFVLLSRREVGPSSDGTADYRASKSADSHARYAKFPEAEAPNN